MEVLRPLYYFLGVEVHSGPSSLCLTQSKYAKNLLFRSKMDSCQSAATLMAICTKLFIKEKDAPYPDPSHYNSIVGALQYFTFTRSGLSFLVNYAGQFM